MNAKNILVSFLLIASVLFLVATASAYSVTSDLADTTTVKVDGITILEDVTNGDSGTITDPVSVIAGETITVKVAFTTDDIDGDTDTIGISDVRIRAELEGDKADVTAVTPLFDVEDNKTYVKTLTLKVPSDLDEDELSGDLTLNLKIWNSDYETEVEDIVLNVQRTSYDVAIKSVITSNTISAGEKMPVEVVLKNVGYNNVDDVYVTVSIPELNIQKSAYFGDIITENYKDSILSLLDDEDKVTVSAKLNLEVPYTAKTGVYTLTVEAKNDETTSTKSEEISIENSVSEIAIKSGSDLILLNPTNQLKVYTVKYNTNEVIVVVPAVSSKTVPIVTAEDADVSVYSEATLLSTVKFSGSAVQSETQLTNPVFVLTVILAIVFLVLLVVLVVLITKKPQKTEEFGESYY